MSGARSILEIDLKDEKFQAFWSEFQKYQSAVNELPAGWGKIGEATKGAAGNFHDLVHAAQVTAASTLATAVNQERLLHALESSNTSGERLERTTKSMHRNITDSTLAMLKWSGILGAVTTAAGGLLGAGGLWGVERLGTSAAGMRRNAMGLGITPGEQQAFDINFSRGVDNPDALLGNIADAKSDQSKWAIFSSLGIRDFKTRDAADMAPDVLSAARNLYKQNPSAQFMHARGVDQLLSLADWRRVGGMSDKEFQGMNAGFQKDRKGLDIGDGTLAAWQDFTQQMQRAAAEIEKTFIVGLAPLAPSLTNLSKGFSAVVDAFLNAPELKKGITDLAGDLQAIAGWLKKPEMPWNDKDVVPVDKEEEDKHPTGLGKWLYRNFDRLRDPSAGNTWLSNEIGALINGNIAPTGAEGWTTGMAGLPAGFAQQIFKQEAGVNPDGSPRISPAGAIGIGQLMPSTARDLGVDPYDLNQNVNGSLRYMKQLLTRYNGDQSKAAAAYNWGMGKLDADIAKHGSEWDRFLPPETTHYVEEFRRALGKPNDGASDDAAAKSHGQSNAHHIVHTVLPSRIKVDLDVKSTPGGNPTVSASMAGAR